MYNDLSYFSHYLRTLLFITFYHALYKHLEINRNEMNFVKSVVVDWTFTFTFTLNYLKKREKG